MKNKISDELGGDLRDELDWQTYTRLEHWKLMKSCRIQCCCMMNTHREGSMLSPDVLSRADFTQHRQIDSKQLGATCLIVKRVRRHHRTKTRKRFW